MTARTLVLLRHAKAETPGEMLDFERRLAPSGVADAGAVGSWLAEQGLRPDLVICSAATRTRQTWQYASAALAAAHPGAPSPEIRYEQGLYDGGRTEVIDLLRAVPDSVRTVLVVGHNPTMSDVSILLSPYDEDAVLVELKTSGLAVHRADGSWSGTEPGSMPLALTHTARG
jgi:phosphohistidine phosphatase